MASLCSREENRKQALCVSEILRIVAKDMKGRQNRED
jgi:hypothetical protein